MASTPPPFEPPPPPPQLPPIAELPPPMPGAEAVPPLPFEQPGYPFLEGLYETAKLVILRPDEAFTRVRASQGLERAVWFAVIFGWIGVIASQVYNIALQGAMRNVLPGMTGMEDVFFSTGISIFTMLLAPILVLIGVFITSLVIHLFLLLFGAGGGGLATTVRVVCYASPVQITQVLPICGGIIGFFWGIILYIVGLAAAHQTSHSKAALAVLLPLLLCCACIAAALATFGAAIWAAVAGALPGLR